MKFASLIVGAVASPLTWEDCGDASTHGRVTDIAPLDIPLGKTTLTAKGTIDEDVNSATFNFVAKVGPVPILKGNGNVCEDNTIKLPFGAGSILVHAVDCPVSAGDIELTLDIDALASAETLNGLVNIQLDVDADNGDKVFCAALTTTQEVDSTDAPTRPHLSQAWSAMSTGDGMQGATGQEHYLFSDKEAHHLWDYGATGQKLWTCPDRNSYSCTAYYVKLNAVDCCYCDDVDEPKEWDLPKDNFFTKTKFVAYEDTTELNDNPVKGAEHWTESSILPKVLTVTYDYFLHREGTGDVISHRIDFNTSVAQSGSILYGNFEVAHDIDAHRQHFAIPNQCKGNIVDCCDNMDALDKKYDFHSYALRKAKEASSISV